MIDDYKARPHGGLYLLLVIASISTSLWSLFVDPIIKPDGILNLHAAQAFSKGDIDAALSFDKWPLYSYLISLVHQITNIEMQASAHLLNGFFHIIICIFFILLISELGGVNSTLFIAAFVIVFSPGLNEIRSFIVRDHGYIAFYLLSLYVLIRALHSRCKRLLIVSMASMVIATLFRIEGAVFLIATPIIYLTSRLHTKPIKRLTFYLLVAVTTIILFSIFGWWLYSPQEDVNYSLYSLKNIQNGWVQAIQYLDTKIEILKDKILDTSSSTTGRLVFLWTVTGLIFTEVLVMLSIPYAFLIGYAINKNLIFPARHGIRPWELFIFFNVLILAVFTLTKFFLTDRYPLALAVTLSVTIPFSLTNIYSRWRSGNIRKARSRWAYAILVLLLLANCIDGLTSSTDDRYLKESGLWLKNNISRSNRLYTDDVVVGFYSGQIRQQITVVKNKNQLIHDLYQGEWINYDYLALNVNPDPEHEEHLDITLWVEPEKVFVNDKKREVRIYNIKKYREREDQ